MDILRTPDKRFMDLPEWTYEARYVEADGIRIHHVDEGPRAAAPVLLLHGEPSWGYLYRHMIPPLVAQGHRVVAPDLVGFGRSDKPAAVADYSYERHIAWMRAVIERLDLHDITLVGQDWGGLIGLRLVTEIEDRFSRVVLANTGLPTGDHELSAAWRRFRDWAETVAVFPVGAMLQSATTTDLPTDVLAAYDAPFPDETFKAGVRAFPSLVPSHPDHPDAPANRAAWEELVRWDKPLLTAFSDGDPITAGGERIFQHKVPGAAGQPHVTIEGAGHFLQEDAGPRFADVVDRFVATTSRPG